MPEQLFTDLYRDTEHLAWAPAEQVQERGRQRTRRTRIAAGVASAVAVAVIATGAVAVAGRPQVAPPVPPATGSPMPTGTPDVSPSRSVDPTPSGRPSKTPSATPTTPTAPTSGPSLRPPTTDPAPRSVPEAAMLQLADLPAGYRRVEPEFDGDGSLWFMTTVFDCDRDPAPWREVGELHMVFSSAGTSWSQEVTRHSGDGAAQKMASARSLASRCTSSRPGDSITVLADGLGGDESVLMGVSYESRRSQYLLVRQGDLVSQIQGWVGDPDDEAATREYVRKVAARLCAGTDAC